MIDFKLNGKSIQVASSWDELSYEQFFKTFQPLDFKALISVCANIPNDENIQKAQITGNIEGLVTAMNFIKKPAVWDKPVLQCGPYKLPINHKGQYNIQYESLGQFEDMRNWMAKITGETQVDRAKSITETYPYFVAIYLQKIRDGEYSYSKAMDMVEEIKSYPAREVVTLGSFFLVKLSSLLNGTPDNSQSITPSPKKSKRVSTNSRKPSARLQRSRK